jgi:hypothetical protein
MFYLDLVNRAFAALLPNQITSADLNTTDPRIVRQVEEHFRQHDITTAGSITTSRPRY